LKVDGLNSHKKFLEDQNCTSGVVEGLQTQLCHKIKINIHGTCHNLNGRCAYVYFFHLPYCFVFLMEMTTLFSPLNFADVAGSDLHNYCGDNNTCYFLVTLHPNINQLT